jgi:hypothetical protein
MYDIKPLESEWKKYRKKRQKPWYIGGFIFLILALLAITFSGNVKIDLSSLTTYFKTMKSKELPMVKEVKSHVLLDNALDTLETEKSIVLEKPFTIETVEKKETNTPNILVDIPVLEEVRQPMNENVSKDRKKVHIDIIETSSVTAYKDVEKRFLQSHDVDDAMFLAKSYYKKGLFEKSEYWALETNKIDENIEESLFIFAKSKAKLGHKNEAESILTNYISKTGSQEAKNLLFRIKNDTL